MGNVPNQQTKSFFQAANALYLEHSELWEDDFSWDGFQWVCADDAHGNTIAYLRKNKKGDFLLTVCNFSPNPHPSYRLGVPVGGKYGTVLNTDDAAFGGAGGGDKLPVSSQKIPSHGQAQSIQIDLPPMSSVIYRCVRKNPVRRKKA